MPQTKNNTIQPHRQDFPPTGQHALVPQLSCSNQPKPVFAIQVRPKAQVVGRLGHLTAQCSGVVEVAHEPALGQPGLAFPSIG